MLTCPRCLNLHGDAPIFDLEGATLLLCPECRGGRAGRDDLDERPIRGASGHDAGIGLQRPRSAAGATFSYPPRLADPN